MEITAEKKEEKLIIFLNGRLDTTNAKEAEEEIDKLLGDEADVTFDLKDLIYLSSAGLRILLLAQKRMLKQGRMTVKNVNETVTEIFETTGFNEILTIE
ncbi:MAG: STAS domain-containing protein [Erysipelotrichaceae bacterium]|nr:STAS domain-containing protein [Erysipelotrichaceae bacterium]